MNENREKQVEIKTFQFQRPLSQLFVNIRRALIKKGTVGWAISKESQVDTWDWSTRACVTMAGRVSDGFNGMNTCNAGKSLVHQNSTVTGSYEKSSQKVKLNYAY